MDDWTPQRTIEVANSSHAVVLHADMQVNIAISGKVYILRAANSTMSTTVHKRRRYH
jgi:hypothetical protein